MKSIIAGVLMLLMTSCTSFRTNLPDGTTVDYSYVLTSKDITFEKKADGSIKGTLSSDVRDSALLKALDLIPTPQ